MDPLSDLVVIDLTRARSGPVAARQFADWGADVLKVEAPASAATDDVMGGNRLGFDFQNLHRNKRSMTLNLKDPRGRQIFLDLARTADVVLENYRPDVKHRLGIDYESVRAVNSRIVYGSISGFGQDGPYADRPGLDQIAQGMGGLMSITGLPGQGPVRAGIAVADVSAGLLLAQGVLIALHARERTGVGEWVHTSLLEAQIAVLDFQAARWLIGHEVPPQAGNDHPTGVPTGVFPTADGSINIAASGDAMFRRLCEALDLPALPDHPDYRSGGRRSRNRVAMNDLLAERTRTKTSAAWIEELNAIGVPCGPIYTIDQTMADPQVRHLGIASGVTHPTLGPIEVVGQGVSLAGAGGRPEVRSAAPEAGEHTDDILGRLGYGAEAIAELRRAGVV